MQNILSLTYELKRLKELLSYQILDTPTEKEFDSLVKIAAHVFNVPVSAVTFLDENRQWIKASVGINVCETDRRDAVCNYTIRQNTINEIVDMRLDDRYSSFPFVAGEPFYRYYAGVPLITENNYRIGAFCIMDTITRRLNEEEKAFLSVLGRVAMIQIEISLKNSDLEKINTLQKRIFNVINQNANNREILCKEETNLQEEHANCHLNTDDLIALSELLKKQADYIVSSLNEKIEWKRLELQKAVNGIKCEQLKRIVNDVMRDIDAAKS